MSRHTAVLILAICGFVLWPASTAPAAPMLVLDIDGQGGVAEIGPGETVTAAVLASEIPPGGDGRGLFGFGFVLEFDATALSITTPEVDDLWTGFSATLSETGRVGATANRFGEADGPFGDGIPLATFEITALAMRDSPLGLAPFTGPGDNVLFDGSVLDAAPDLFFTTASVTAIPEPSAALVFALGFAALARFPLRRVTGRT